MNKIYYFLFLSLLLGACAKEDALEPTGANDDYFTVPATATDPESVMRREFYEETGGICQQIYPSTLGTGGTALFVSDGKHHIRNGSRHISQGCFELLCRYADDGVQYGAGFQTGNRRGVCRTLYRYFPGVCQE